MTQKVNGAAYPGIWVERQVSFVKMIFNKDISALEDADLLVLGTTTPAGAGTVADSTYGIVESAVVQAVKTLETRATVLGLSTYNVLSYQSGAGATSSGDVLTVDSTDGLAPGMSVSVSAGTGAFADGTYITEILDGTTCSLSAAPTTALSGGATVVVGSGSSVDAMVGFAEGWFSDESGLISVGLPVVNAQAVVTTAGAAPTDVVGDLVSVSPTALLYALEFAAFDGTMPVATADNGFLVLGPGSTSGATPTNSTTGTPGYYPTTI